MESSSPSEEILTNESISKIVEGVYISDCGTANNLEVLQMHGITHVISLGRFDEHVQYYAQYDFITYMNVFVDDDPNEDIRSYFDSCVEFMKNKRVLVHCYAGVSRSVAIVLVYLMRVYNMKYDTAMDTISRRRPCISVNKGFLQQIKKYGPPKRRSI